MSGKLSQARVLRAARKIAAYIQGLKLDSAEEYAAIRIALQFMTLDDVDALHSRWRESDRPAAG